MLVIGDKFFPDEEIDYLVFNTGLHQLAHSASESDGTIIMTLNHAKLEIILRFSPYSRATANNADAAQVGRVNVASVFRETQTPQVAKSAKRSEISRPSFNQVFRALLWTCLSISVSIASMAYFGRIFENPLSETDPEISNRYVTKTPSGISSFLRQSLVLVRRCKKLSSLTDMRRMRKMLRLGVV
jgi:hypothetical protein